MSEDLTEYMHEEGLESPAIFILDIDTLERVGDHQRFAPWGI